MENKIIEYIEGVALQKGIAVDKNTDLFASGIFDSLEIISFLEYLGGLKIDFESDDIKYENFQSIEAILKWLVR